MKLNYKAVSKDGKIIQGIIDAKDIAEAARHLRSRDYLPLRITRKEKDIFSSLPFNRFSGSNLIFFTRQLSSMLSSGLTLIQALNIIRDEVSNPVVKEVVTGIIVDVEEGKTFSSALEMYPKEFNSIYISSIKAGEASGLLDKVLLRLADNIEKSHKLKSSIKSAMIYPIIVILGIIGVMFVMMIFVIPQLSTMYEGMNIEMPLPTRVVIWISHFASNYWPLILGILALSLFAIRRWSKTESGKIVLDGLMLKIPIFGKLIKQNILTEFTRTFSLLIGSGTLVIESILKSGDVAGNILYKNAISDIAKKVEKGVTVGDAMTFHPLFPPLLVQMVKIGEETGKLDDSLIKVSEYYERETENTVKNLQTMMEPIIIAILGLGVAFMIISVITPIYKLTSAF